MTMTLPPLNTSRLALCGSLALALSLPTGAWAAPGHAPHGERGGHVQCGHRHAPFARISVGGAGETRVAPDLAQIDVGVTVQAATAADASAQNAQAQSKVIEALKAAGLADENIKTSGLRLGPVYVHAENKAPEISGYQADNTVTIRVRELDRLGEILDAIVAAGSNQIGGISFLREDSAEAEDEARRDAVQDATRKAKVMAEAAGLELGPVLMIRDGDQPVDVTPVMMRAADASEKSFAPVAPGELSVSASVAMDFATIDPAASKDCGAHGPKNKDHEPPSEGMNEGAAGAGEPAPKGAPDKGPEGAPDNGAATSEPKATAQPSGPDTEAAPENEAPAEPAAPDAPAPSN